MKLNRGERLITVNVDGGRWSHTDENGKRTIIRTIVTNNKITLEKCNQIVSRINSEFGYLPERLKFNLSIYTETEGNDGDWPEDCLLDKTVYYNVKQNRLRVYENGTIAYENLNGMICDDPHILADNTDDIF